MDLDPQKGEGALGSLNYAKFTFTPRGDRIRGGDQLDTSLSWAYVLARRSLQSPTTVVISKKSYYVQGYSKMIGLSMKSGTSGTSADAIFA